MTYAPVEGVAVPEGAAAPPAPPAGTLTGDPGLGGSLPDGEADPEPEPGEPEEPELPLDGEPEEPELPLDGEPEEPELPLDGEPELKPELGAAVGVAVTVT